MRMNHTCVNCLYKHLSNILVRVKKDMKFYEDLSTVKVLVSEVMTGYDSIEYNSWIIGHLACAQEHVLEVNEDFANRIRDLRLLWYPEGTIQHRFTFKDVNILKDLIKDAGKLVVGVDFVKKPRKPCGCGGKK